MTTPKRKVPIIFCDPAWRSHDLAFFLGTIVGIAASIGFWWMLGAVVVAAVIEVTYENWSES